MKNYLLLLTTMCLSATLAAQPPEFAFNSGCSTAFGNLYAQLTLDGQPLPNGAWVAAVDPDGNIAGVAQATTLSGFQGLVILPVYEDLDSPPACDVPDGGIDCEGPDGCEQFGVIAYIENEADPSMNCFAAAVSYIDYVKVPGPGGELEIDGFTSSDVVSGAATIISLSSTNPPCYLNYEDAFIALPVELTSFAGRTAGKSILLGWETASEDGNEGFAIERSADGRNFTKIGYQAGAGTSTSSITYSFTDDAPLSGSNYYRLRQNDLTGGFSYSEVIVIDFIDEVATSYLRVAPNPVTDEMRVNLVGEWEETFRVQLIDQNGKQVKNLTKQNTTTFNLMVGDLPAGIYQLWVQDGTRQQTQRVVIR